ncbi:hypothetical protein A4H97_02580 [Niastella yeongjuensis]|uniref:Uncharacterized protein n=1 Tax=Niastella yeongjuensis TaxID=354355 RepID=A0A1V9EXV9_9BACT|nr:hypothetical protein [Niastella yeongjuensis]OQP50744.1 hypothetical protein A4H97_02580 [Niastella yeongjuensis]SEN20002.1 hypothetical protein SAMN05660816_00428 [Niastella yeongjuensis]
MSFNCYHIRTADFNFPTGGGQEVEITRDNYEAYFVMYIDEELHANERMAVEQFIQQNPDLEEELVMLQQSVLRPDEGIVFDQKESLFKHTVTNDINERNCEEYFVLYGDDELTNEEKDKVEQFVYKHPQYQADFELIQQVKLVPDNALTFPDKSYLYRSEEDDARVIVFSWYRFTAAAVVLLTMGSVLFYASTHFVADKNDVVTAPTTKPTAQPQPSVVIDSKSPQADVAVAPQRENNDIVKESRKNISKPGNIQSALYVQQVEQQPEEVPAGNNEKSLSASTVDVAVGKLYERPEVEGTVITNTVRQSIALQTATVEPDEEPVHSQTAVLTASVNKTPLRGFFRKVSRVVDKVTSPDDNGKAGIRIANLEFAIK